MWASWCRPKSQSDVLCNPLYDAAGFKRQACSDNVMRDPKQYAIWTISRAFATCLWSVRILHSIGSCPKIDLGRSESEADDGARHKRQNTRSRGLWQWSKGWQFLVCWARPEHAHMWALKAARSRLMHTHRLRKLKPCLFNLCMPFWHTA
jgi:hypothetical protein